MYSVYTVYMVCILLYVLLVYIEKGVHTTSGCRAVSTYTHRYKLMCRFCPARVSTRR